MAEEILVRQGTQNNTLQDIEAVLSRWTVRLQCLRRLQRLQGLASEANALFSSLPQLYTLPLHTGQQQSEAIFETYIPFDLILLQAVLPAYLRGDQFIVLRHLQEIAYGCKLEYRRTREVHWITKLHTTGIAMVNVLYALGETRQAVDLLSSLVEQNKRQDVQLLSALGRLAMDIGDMRTADSVIVELKSLDEGSDEYKSLRIAKLLCDGDWNQAEQTARAWSNSTRGSSTLAKANLAACCMYSERVQEVINFLLWGRSIYANLQ